MCICKFCENFKLNGGVSSFDVIYNKSYLTKLGTCSITNELKNEFNTCEQSNEIVKKTPDK